MTVRPETTYRRGVSAPIDYVARTPITDRCGARAAVDNLPLFTLYPGRFAVVGQGWDYVMVQ
jgi:hypothetical protein